MGFKDLLEEWKNYQKHKLIMANQFPCIVTFPSSSIIRGTLSFRGSGAARHLYFTCIRREVKGKVLLSHILGTAPQGSVITINQPNEKVIVVRFPSKAVQIAAHEAFLMFKREEFGSMMSSSSSIEDY